MKHNLAIVCLLVCAPLLADDISVVASAQVFDSSDWEDPGLRIGFDISAKQSTFRIRLQAPFDSGNSPVREALFGNPHHDHPMIVETTGSLRPVSARFWAVEWDQAIKDTRWQIRTTIDSRDGIESAGVGCAYRIK